MAAFLPPVDLISDVELSNLNKLLPWACFTLDSRDRIVGRPFSDVKRNTPQAIPDPRIVQLNELIPLYGRSILEMGCFEGVHTIGLCHFGANVTAVDARIEHVVKTQTRCALYGYHPNVYCIDLESRSLEEFPEFDVLHHVGVLYHLTDPVGHLQSVLPSIRDTVLIDTHIARPNEVSHEYKSCGKNYKIRLYKEGGREEPFSGMGDHSKWLLHEDLIDILAQAGFNNFKKQESENQRNGLRLRIVAQRTV
jgi:hypothetical protein